MYQSNDQHFPRYSLNPNLQIFLNRDAPYHPIPFNFDTYYLEHFDMNKKYYSGNISVFKIFRFLKNCNFAIPILLIITCIVLLLMFQETSTAPNRGSFRDFATPTISLNQSQLDYLFGDYLKSINSSKPVADNVNMLQPHHITVICAIGDSITIGYKAENYFENSSEPFPGNSFITGADFEIDQHFTLFNMFRYIASKIGSEVFGGSVGKSDTGLNVAVNGSRSENIELQSVELIRRIRHNSQNNIPPHIFQKNIENGIDILKKNLPRTVVLLISGFPHESREYTNALVNIQNSKKFEGLHFSVVVQPFATNLASLLRYRSPFTTDTHHPTKMGHAILAVNLWRNLFEKLPQKTSAIELRNATIFKLTPENSLIRTIGNS